MAWHAFRNSHAKTDWPGQQVPPRTKEMQIDEGNFNA